MRFTAAATSAVNASNVPGQVGPPVVPQAASLEPIQPASTDARRAPSRAAWDRVLFRNNLTDPTNQGVLETPFLDDITFTWQPASGPRVLSWQEGER